MAFNFDPEFPNRPQHEDFAALSAIVLAQDQAADKGASASALLEGVVDFPSLSYLAIQRVMRAEALAEQGGSVAPVLYAIYLDAFRAGAIFGRDHHERLRDVATPTVS